MTLTDGATLHETLRESDSTSAILRATNSESVQCCGCVRALRCSNTNHKSNFAAKSRSRSYCLKHFATCNNVFCSVPSWSKYVVIRSTAQNNLQCNNIAPQVGQNVARITSPLRLRRCFVCSCRFKMSGQQLFV